MSDQAFVPSSIETSAELVEALRTLLVEQAEDQGFDDLDTRTFEEAMLLTRDEGLVLRIGKAEFQITVVRSR